MQDLISILVQSKATKKQHDFRIMAEGASMNLGIVSQFAILGTMCLHQHTNVSKCKRAQQDLISIVHPKAKRIFGDTFEGGFKLFMKMHKEASPDIPCLMNEDEGSSSGIFFAISTVTTMTL